MLLLFYLTDYSFHTKYKTTTKGPTLIEPTLPKVLSNIPISQSAGGSKTGNPWLKHRTDRPGLHIERGNNNGDSNKQFTTGNDDSAYETAVEKRTGSRASKCSGTFLTLCMCSALHVSFVMLYLSGILFL